MALQSAHQGYEYQDLLTAIRLVDVLLGSIDESYIDIKMVHNDVFDDLTTVSANGHRDRIQFKHSTRPDKPLNLSIFSTQARDLRLDRVIASVLSDRDGPGADSPSSLYRVVSPSLPPEDLQLLQVLEPADPDPGPFVEGARSVRLMFRADVLWRIVMASEGTQAESSAAFDFLTQLRTSLSLEDLSWVCKHLIIELAAPAASFDPFNPGDAERLLLKRVRVDIGAGVYPNADRSPLDVSESLLRSARRARQGIEGITRSGLLSATQIRSDYGAVSRRHPVDRNIEVQRSSTVDDLVGHARDAAVEGRNILLVGPPGHGKSWVCQQLVETLTSQGWLVAEHYCYLSDADGDRRPRILAESLFGSLVARIADFDEKLTSDQRPRFAANEGVLEGVLVNALEGNPGRPVALIVDGIDHVTRIIGKAHGEDPSTTFARALAELRLPQGSTLIVLSQPGNHLQPLREIGASEASLPGLNEDELRELAARLGIHGSSEDPSPEFMTALMNRSEGNALYATYLCREVLRAGSADIPPHKTVQDLPPFDGTLRTYYARIQASLGESSAWVADVMALIDFPVLQSELKEIRPDNAHRVDRALEVLKPVLLQRATQGGIRIYHESFARFLRLSFHSEEEAKKALLTRIGTWLEGKGIFDDSRAFRHLLPTLVQTGSHTHVVDFVDRDFVVRSIAAAFPPLAILENLATAICSAAQVEDWPAVARCVEMSRSVETYRDERFDTGMLGHIDVVASLVGPDRLAARLLHNGRTTMTAVAGLEICAALDGLGTVPPWREYMIAYLRQHEGESPSMAQPGSSTEAAWLRGRLRLASVRADSFLEDALSSKLDERVGAPIDWVQLAARLDGGELSAHSAVNAILETLGMRGMDNLIDEMSHPGACCLEVADAIAAGRVPGSGIDEARDWADRAYSYGVPPGNLWRLAAIGTDVGGPVDQVPQDARDGLLRLTQEIKEGPRHWSTLEMREWLDGCTVAARNDPLGLAAVESSFSGPGWYHCWLRFTISIAIAETLEESKRANFALDAFRILAEVEDPFLGEPRACDLFPIHGLIFASIQRGILLLDEAAWEDAMQILDRVSNQLTTTMSGELGGPLPPDRLLGLVVDTATPAGHHLAKKIIYAELEQGTGRYYSDLAVFQLLAARMALNIGERDQAQRHWINSCQLLAAYGFHKDITIYELLDPLPTLIAKDPAWGRTAVEKVQPLCERMPHHTDGRATRRVWRQWWKYLAMADPCAVSRLVVPRLLRSCNDPDYLMHAARTYLWRSWQDRVDPIVGGALRLTLEEALEPRDPSAIERLADASDGTGSDRVANLMTKLLARVDERPFTYGVSNDTELLSRDDHIIGELNRVAMRAGVPSITPLPMSEESPGETTHSASKRDIKRTQSGRREPAIKSFDAGEHGIAQAIRAWDSRPYDTSAPQWHTERFANIFGYRLMEIVDSGHMQVAEDALPDIAAAGGMSTPTPQLLSSIGEGLERRGQHRLAALAYTLVWTRTRGQGGWLSFGGQTNIDFLQKAVQLDHSTVPRIIGREIGQAVLREVGTYGITQALIVGFAQGEPNLPLSTAQNVWSEAFLAIEDRVPRVSEHEDPDDVYRALSCDNPDESQELIEEAFGAATVAGLTHAGWEQKRRSLLAIKTLIEVKPSSVEGAIDAALSSLSDPATLTWLLQVVEMCGEKALPIISAARKTLVKLANGEHLIIRTVARRLVPNEVELSSFPSDPDPELLYGGNSGILLPEGFESDESTGSQPEELVDAIAGHRISRGERILPGLRSAVCRRVKNTLSRDAHRHRLRAQLEAYGGKVSKHVPNAFLATLETVEDSLQRVCATARSARLMNGQATKYPLELEESLAEELKDDSDIWLPLEQSRYPRPDIPYPAGRSDPLWEKFAKREAKHPVNHSKGKGQRQKRRVFLGTASVRDIGKVPVLRGGEYDGWHLVASVEQRLLRSIDFDSRRREVSDRYNCIELRLKGDVEGLNSPPVTRGHIGLWKVPSPRGLIDPCVNQSGPLVGITSEPHHSEGLSEALGVPLPVLSPTSWMFEAIELTPSELFVLEDHKGPALAQISWRSEYETSDYHLSWPRLRGAGLVVRSDVFPKLVRAAQGNMVLREFAIGAWGFSV